MLGNQLALDANQKCGFLYLSGICPNPAPTCPAWGVYCLPGCWGASGVQNLGEGRSLASLEGNPLADPAPSGLLHSSPISLEGRTSEKREMCTSNFPHFKVKIVVDFFSWSSFLFPTPPQPPSLPQISLQTFKNLVGLNMHRLLICLPRLVPLGSFLKNMRN